MSQFVSLHNHTYFSILDALSSPKALFQRAKELGQPAIAITDHASLAGVWDALKASKETGVKLIVGCELYFTDDISNKENKLRHIILIAKNAVGYNNLLTLNKKGYDNPAYHGKKVISVIDWNLLEQHHEGLICLTSCSNGILGQPLIKKNFAEAERVVAKLKDIFKDDLGLEVQTHNTVHNSTFWTEEVNQNFVNRQVINLAKSFNVKVVPTTNSHYIFKEDADTHDVLLAIGSHQPKYSNFRVKYPQPDLYVKSAEEVVKHFSRNYGEEFAQEICANSLYFADKCEFPAWIDPKYSNPSGKELPTFPIEDEADYQEFLQWKQTLSSQDQQVDDDKLFLRFRCFKYFDAKVPADKKEEYLKRLEEEFDVLEYCGISSYMLIVADYVQWAKNNGVSVGPGRGSAGGSLVGYLTGIHDADPIQYGLVFARFHNKLKSSYSDIDLDFSTSGRSKVEEYVTKKYGESKVAHVSNLSTITPKVYIRDIARALELGGSKEEAVKIGNLVADTVSNDVKTIDQALKNCPLFAEYCNKYPEFVTYKSLCGIIRNWSTHAAGLIITKRDLVGLVPLRKDKEGVVCLEYEKERTEENGLVKMDILGLSNLDLIDQTIELIKANNKPVPVIDYNVYDKKTYDLIASGNTLGVFQFGTSAGTIDLCKKLPASSIEDLATITTLARPASKEIREDYIATKFGKKEPTYLHEKLKNAFSSTLGFSLYDESLLVMAKDIADWDYGEADKLRKLTKEKGKNPQKAKKWKEEFIEGSVKNNIDAEMADKIWVDIVEPFAKYSFNKSHAVLYSMISFHTAYLKAHYPIEFLLANLMAEVKSNAPNAEANLKSIKNELRQLGVKILPPDINTSQLTYTLNDNELLTGLDGLKFVGEDAIVDILNKRPFKDFFDFMLRVDSRKVRANTIQALAASGALDRFNIPRRLMFLYCSDFRKKLTVWLKKHNPATESFVYPWSKESDWTNPEIYALEHKYIGESFTVSLAKAYGNFFNENFTAIKAAKQLPEKTNIRSIRAVVKDIFEFRIKKESSKYYGHPMVKATIEDPHGDRGTLTIFPDALQKMKKRLKEIKKSLELSEGLALAFSASVNVYEDEKNLILNDVFTAQAAPALPADLKNKKVAVQDVTPNTQPQSLLEDIEDQLINEGLLNIEDED